MADVPGGRPPEDSPAGTAEGGEPVMEFTLEIRFLPSWRGARKHIDEAVVPLIGEDNKFFDGAGKAGPASGPPPGADPGAVATETRWRRRLGQGVLHKREIRVGHADSRITTRVDYRVEGGGEDIEIEVQDHGRLALWAHATAACGGGDPRIQVSMRSRFRGDLGGKAFLRALRENGDAPMLALDVDSCPAGFVEWAGPNLGAWAIVAELDAGAARRLAESAGQEWSCLGGARLFRPDWSGKDRPGRHPAWERREILPDGHDEDFAARAFRRAFLRAFFVTPREGVRKRLAETGERVAKMREVCGELEDLRAQVEEAVGEARLESDTLREERDRPGRDGRDLGPRPGGLREGRTAQRAVEWAAAALGDDLMVGEQAREGAGGLAPDAGPPGTVFRHLARLAEFAREMRGGGVTDDTAARWFRERGCQVGREPTRPQGEFPRDFPAGGETQGRDWHTMPDGQADAGEVRIHFGWDPGSGKVLVGRIGPHPRPASGGTR